VVSTLRGGPVLEMLYYSPFNHLTGLLAQEYFIADFHLQTSVEN